MRDEATRREQPGLTEAEAAFYDAIKSRTTLQYLRWATTRGSIAAELQTSVRQKGDHRLEPAESVRATMRTKV